MRPFDQRTTGSREADALRALSALRDRAGGLGDEALDATLDARVPPFPLKVQIQTWTRCNAACAMCPYPEITGEPGFVHQRMPEALYRAILDQLAGRGVERLSLFLMNEPLLDKRMPEWLAMARAALPDVTLGLFSNGAALTPDLARRLADAGLDELCISVHGFERDTYERVMGGLSFERVMRNLRAVVPLYERGALGGMHFQIVTGDVPEVVATLDRAPPELLPHVLLKGFSNERTVSEVRAGLAAPRPRGRRRPLCQRPFVKLYVMHDGECVLCNCDWRRRVVLGRVGERTIEEIWQGARYRAVRRSHVRDRFAEGSICERCDYPWVIDDE